MRTVAIVLFVSLAACGAKQQQQQTPHPAPPEDPFVTSCHDGVAKSCLMAANDAETGGHKSRAADLYLDACRLDEVNGCALAGGLLAEEGNRRGALDAFGEGCDKGDGTSCYGAGLLALGIFGGEPDHTAAATSFEKGCAAGLQDACGEFANLLSRGQGVALDLERADRIRKAACDGGHAASCTRLGLEAWKNQSDQPAARSLFEKACVTDAPDPDGCGWLGWMLWSKLGGEADEARGVALLEASCENDSATGCALRAMVHQRVGEKDAAKQSLEKACSLDPAQCEAIQKSFGESTTEAR